VDEQNFPGEPEMVRAAEDLTYVDTGDTEEELLAKLPPVPEETDDMRVVTSLRIPLSLHRRLKEYAEAHGTKPSVLIREWIELHLSAEEEDRQIPLADALRALASLRPRGHSAA
jgi:predicted DNA-binding protein